MAVGNLETVPLNGSPQGRGSRKYVLGGIVAFTLVVVVIVGISVVSVKNQTNKGDFTSSGKDGTEKPHFEEALFSYDNFSTAATYKIPCVYNAQTPSGCADRVRTVPCGSINPNGHPTLTINDKPACESAPVKLQQILNVQFYQNPNTNDCLEITAQIGECWGKNPINSGVYECQGECGAGCIKGCGLFNLGGGWSRNCFRHDICSWYFGASGGGSDKHCGKSYDQASGDTFNCKCDIKDPDNCNF